MSGRRILPVPYQITYVHDILTSHMYIAFYFCFIFMIFFNSPFSYHENCHTFWFFIFFRSPVVVELTLHKNAKWNSWLMKLQCKSFISLSFRIVCQITALERDRKWIWCVASKGATLNILHFLVDIMRNLTYCKVFR